MAEVFISYKREDRELAEQVSNLLGKAGYSTWFDVSLIAGEAFAESIRAETEAAGMVLTIWSRQSWASSWVQAESLYGFNAGKHMGLVVDDVVPGIPFNAAQTIMCKVHRIIDIDAQDQIIAACRAKLGPRDANNSAHEIFFDSLIQKAAEAPTYSVMGIEHDPSPYLLLAAKEVAQPDFSHDKIVNLISLLVSKHLHDDAADLVARLARNLSHLGSDVSGVGPVIASIGYSEAQWRAAVKKHYPGEGHGVGLRVADILFESGDVAGACRLAEDAIYNAPRNEGLWREFGLDRLDKFRGR